MPKLGRYLVSVHGCRHQQLSDEDAVDCNGFGDAGNDDSLEDVPVGKYWYVQWFVISVYIYVYMHIV